MASLYFKYAAMNSGKSTQLLQAHYNYRERGMHPFAMIPRVDHRAGVGVIAARIGISLPAYVFDAETDIFQTVQARHAQQKIDAVLIDEAQFMSEAHVLQCARVVDELEIPVLCYGLKADFRARLFEGSEALLRYADKIEEIKTVCWCGRKATHNARHDNAGRVLREGEQIVIGGNNLYTALCRKHFMEGKVSAEGAAEASGPAQTIREAS